MKWNNLNIMPMPKPSEWRISCMVARSLGLHKQADLLEMVLDIHEFGPLYCIEHFKPKEYKHVHVDLPSRLY